MSPLASAGIVISYHAVNQAPLNIGLENRTADVFSDSGIVTSAII
jgi:hypothetical protein